MGKHWPRQELDGLAARESLGQKVILPVWHGVTEAEVANQSPLLAGRLAANTSQGIDEVARQIQRTVDLSQATKDKGVIDKRKWRRGLIPLLLILSIVLILALAIPGRDGSGESSDNPLPGTVSPEPSTDVRLLQDPSKKPNDDNLSSLLAGSGFAKEERIKQDLWAQVQSIDKQADSRERFPFPRVNRSIEATGNSGSREALPGYPDVDSCIWNGGIRAIIYVSHNDVPFAESQFLFGRTPDEQTDVVVARLFRGAKGYEIRELLKAQVNDPSIPLAVISAAQEELARLQPVFEDLLRRSGFLEDGSIIKP
ncbi:MAG: hypothetical protein R2748_17185 [Bryobacterales bacterium]